MTVTFKLDGTEFIALNGGPHFTFTEAISFVVNCKTQREVDYYWERLSEGEGKGRSGWLKDKYGLSWRIVPDIVGKCLADKDPAKSRRRVLRVRNGQPLILLGETAVREFFIGLTFRPI